MYLPSMVDNKLTNMSMNKVISFKEIMNNDIKNKFNKMTFPDIRETDNGMFIVPTKHIIQTMVDCRIKYLVLDKDMIPVHDCNYSMVQIPEDGYLLMIKVPKIQSMCVRYGENQSMLFEIEYLIKLDAVEVININMIPDNKSMDIYILQPFDFSMCNDELLKIIQDHDNFFKKYIEDALE